MNFDENKSKPDEPEKSKQEGGSKRLLIDE